MTDNSFSNARITPDQFDFFSYSRLFQPSFFFNNGYSLNGINDPTNISEMLIEEYQSILIYSLIRSNIAFGRKILVIGNIPFYLSDSLKENYQLYNLSDPHCLLDEIDAFHIKAVNDSVEHSQSFVSSFDCLVTLSGFDSISFDRIKKNRIRIALNLNNLTKPGGSAYLTFSSNVVNDSETVSALLFFLYKDSDFGLKPLVPITPLSDITKDNDQTARFKTGVNYNNDSVAALSRPFSYNVFFKKDPAQISQHSVTKANDYLKKSPAYIFHHFIKCGGSSLVKSFGKWFQMVYDHVLEADKVNEFARTRINTEVMSSDSCITSHFHYNGVYVFQRYPEVITKSSDFRLFTFIRDPLNFQISLYYFARQRGALQDIPLINFLSYMPNFMSSLFPCTEDNFEEVLGRYFFIGIVERMQESVDKLAHLTGKKRFIVRRENVSQKDSQREEISDKIIENFRSVHKLDYLIYNYAQKKLDAIIL